MELSKDINMELSKDTNLDNNLNELEDLNNLEELKDIDNLTNNNLEDIDFLKNLLATLKAII